MPEEITKLPPLIDEILGDFGIYQEPKLLKTEFIGRLDTTSIDMEGIKKYQILLSNINYAWRKTLKYEKYFSIFYMPDGSIENFEALNHHIHAYLQDMDTLKNKIEVFLGILKNDLKKFATNKKEVEEFLKSGVKKTDEVFRGISKHRNPHVHTGMRFMDGDLLKAENAHHALELFANPVFDAMLNKEKKPELLAKFTKEKVESFETAKDRWIKMAKNNNGQTSGYIEALLKGIRPLLYQFLNIKPVKEIVDLPQKV